MPRAAARAQEHELLAPPFLEPPTRFLQDLCGSPAAIARLLQRARAVGEPWMSGWSKTAFASLLEASAFRVAEDLTVGDLEDKYFAPLGRSAAPFLRVERFVKAERV